MTVPERLAGRTALVWGGADGLGAATAGRLSREGARVVVADVDATSPSAWERCVADTEESLGGLSILVCAAGAPSTGSILETSLAAWRQTRAASLDGVFFACRAAVPALRRAGGGAIVNVVSAAGMPGDPAAVACDAGRAGMRAAPSAVAHEASMAGVRAAPSAVACDAGRAGMRAAPFAVAHEASMAGVRALTKEVAVFCGRRGDGIRCNSVHAASSAHAATVAATVAFLVSGEAAFITGAEYVVDGRTAA